MMCTMTNMAQQKHFTLEELNFGGTRYNEMTPEKRHYTWYGEELIRKETDCIFSIDEDNKESLLFDIDDIQKAIGEGEILAGINLLNTSFPYPTQPLALIITPSGRWLYNFNTGQVVFRQKTTGSLEWNSESKIDVFSKDNNLWVRMPDNTERQLTTDGSREIVYGSSVHRNEFGIEKGTFFSADGNKFAYYRMDQSMVTDYPQVNTFERIAAYEPDKYPMAGTTSHKVTVAVYDALKDNTVYLELGDVTDRYFTNISWSPDGNSIYLIELNRDQNKASLDQYDAGTGKKIRTICTETDDRYVEPLHPIVFLPWDDSKFLHWSQQDGYWHLYLYSADNGKCIKQLTKGNFVILNILGFNESTKSIILQANKENPLQTNIYAVNITTGEMTLLDNGKGVHTGILSHSGNKVLDQWSEPDVPRAWALLSSSMHNIKDMGVSRNPWEGYATPQYKCGTLKAADGHTDLYYRIVLPSDFDPTKKYPTVVYVYGGPHAHNLAASWHWNSRSWETYMAQKGYITFILDNRGSENRGKEFEQATFRQLGQTEMADQMRGVEHLKSLPYVDTNRMGIHGWSFGGFMTISLMTNYPDVFKVGVAGGPVIDWRLYEIMYTERYMDSPKDNEEGYSKTSLIDKAKDLKGRLLIIIGANDNVVVPQNAMSFLNACNEAGTYPDFYVYPGEEHNMKGHMSVHLHEKITRYFEDYINK